MPCYIYRKVYFDIDDVAWDLQGRVAKRLKLPLELLDEFKVSANERLTEAQREAVLASYCDPETFRYIQFYPGFMDILQLEQAGASLRFKSNSLTTEVAAVKKPQVLAALPDIELDKFEFPVTGVGGSVHKGFDTDAFIVVDDSPYNIASSPAPYNIMPRKYHNQSQKARALVAHKNVYYTPDGDMFAIYRLITMLLHYASVR